MIYNRTSIKRVIAKVLTDNDIQEETIRVSDMIEWAAEALERIGAFPELDTKVSGKGGDPLIPVVDYRADLPQGLHSIIQAAYAVEEEGPFYPMRKSSGSFDSVRGDTIIVDGTDPNNIVYGTEEEKKQTSFTHDIVYTTIPGYINTNMREGHIMLSYRTIPLDGDGYPMVPDDPGFIDALYWYITMKLLYPKWVLGTVKDAAYQNARSSWNYYSKQAYGNSMMPDGDMLESIKNTWNRLIPELGDNNNFFSTTGQEQIIRTHTNNNDYGAVL
jgi:hypothetical protein